MEQFMSRRGFVMASVGGVAGMYAANKGHTSPAPDEGKIFLNYDEAGLDAAYDQREWADNIAEVFERIDNRNERVREMIGEPERHSYGSGASQGLDWYRTDRANAPIHIHLHGGAWSMGSARGSAFLAQPSVSAGAHMVIPDYVKVTDIGGNLLPLGEQCRKAVAWVYRNAGRFNANSDRILISGHSAGGHLAGVVLTTDWSQFDLPANVVKQGLLVSGMYDLHPVSLSSRNEYVTFTQEIITSLSPARHLDQLNAKVVIAFGTKESPEFQRQSRDFFSMAHSKGILARIIEASGMNHFEILEDMGDAQGKVGRAALELMEL
ncbi:MAG: arylformamidase [Halioglobus sp.]|jgi:arylformamidase